MQWGATDKEVVQAWLAFKKLHRQGVVIANIPRDTKAMKHGWVNKWGQGTDEVFMERILSSPEDFRIGHDKFGFDVMSRDYGCLNPGDLPQMLADHMGESNVESLFNPNEVAREVERLALSREAHTHKNCPFCGEKILVQAKKCKHCGEFLDGNLKQGQKTTVVAKEGVFLKTMNFGCMVIFAIMAAIILLVFFIFAS